MLSVDSVFVGVCIDRCRRVCVSVQDCTIGFPVAL